MPQTPQRTEDLGEPPILLPPWSPGGGGGGAVKGVLRRVVSTDTVVSAPLAALGGGRSPERDRSKIRKAGN